MKKFSVSMWFIAKIFVVFFVGVFCFSCASMNPSAVGDLVGFITGNEAIGTGVEGAIKTGQAIEKATEEFTPEQEYYLGRSVGAVILTSYSPYTKNQKLTNYLNKICWSLEVNNLENRPLKGYHLMILDTQEINAFATTGGHIFVSKGIVDSCKNEDQIAAIIAHEMSHIQLKHGTKAIRTDRWSEVGKTAFKSIVEVQAAKAGDPGFNDLVSTFSNSISDMAGTLINSGYSRDSEREADELALQILQNAGYNPAELVNALKDLQSSGNYSAGGFTDTHPSPQERIDNLKKPLSGLPVVATDSARTKRFKSMTGTPVKKLVL